MLGYYALYGKGMISDPKKSAEYYLRAAKLGYSGSQNNVGWAYYKGDGIPRSIPDAVFWITRSADQGEPFAYGSLCEMHAAGDAFAKDDIEAFKWCRLAVDQEPEGHARDYDIELLQAYIHSMSEEDIKKGQAFADKWMPLKQTASRMGDVEDG
jgi:TPR repeat protein